MCCLSRSPWESEVVFRPILHAQIVLRAKSVRHFSRPQHKHCQCITPGIPKRTPPWPGSSARSKAISAPPRDTGSTCAPGIARCPPSPTQPQTRAENATPTHADDLRPETPQFADWPETPQATAQCRAAKTCGEHERCWNGEAPLLHSIAPILRWATAPGILACASCNFTPRKQKLRVQSMRLLIHACPFPHG